MDFHIVDMIIVGLTLFLAIKGLVNGFSKELFNLIAIIGGVAVAARTNEAVGELIAKQAILPEMSIDFQNFIGFILVLLLILFIINFISSIVSRLGAEKPGFISRFIGYLLSLIRYVFIFSLIVFGISNADFLKDKLEKHYKGSQLFEPMADIGRKLLNVQEASKLTVKVNDQNSSLNIDDNSSVTAVNLTEHNRSSEQNASKK
jgi:membrane protein required for colicin V production